VAQRFSAAKSASHERGFQTPEVPASFPQK
jgi:hypothetical protein